MRLPHLFTPISVFLLLLCGWNAKSQKINLKTINDTAYISDHSNDFTFRLYGSRKYTSYTLRDHDKDTKLAYKPNDNYNLGFGFNYKFIGLNIGLNFPFINHDDDKYGTTNYLDVQSHIYLRKLTVDLWGQYYKGFYLSNPSDALSNFNASSYPIRPDIHLLALGIDLQYIFNDEKFSFRAAFLQNEYQKKSSGSWMLGGSIYNVFLRGDTAFVPTHFVKPENDANYYFNKSNIYSIAAGGGGAYTFVIKQHFFITASAMLEAGFNYTVMKNTWSDTKDDRGGPQLITTVRFAAGYNSEKYFAGIHIVDMNSLSGSPIPGVTQTYGGGNVRITVADRFKVKRKTEKKFNEVMDKVIPGK
ncbi:DUF4421 domain-containing protein [Taibaiella soli]|uniref:DUF4421 domain-containing protein n=1 Tax=Taibaiella soli TaxID=1649169 RepID=A0A2W2AYJ8_9BACT|nr:DUF4421 domain-containing protein [Taibaiella soli]PZF73074.1 hypothetical protein DN068_09375 [Taibaiella soli]